MIIHNDMFSNGEYRHHALVGMSAVYAYIRHSRYTFSILCDPDQVNFILTSKSANRMKLCDDTTVYRCRASSTLLRRRAMAALVG